MAEFWVLAGEDASIAGCLIANLDPYGICTGLREYWFDLEGRRDAFVGVGHLSRMRAYVRDGLHLLALAV
jgi:hypothetical protein